jgi:filamentous hemagglutinin family protein
LALLIGPGLAPSFAGGSPQPLTPAWYAARAAAGQSGATAAGAALQSVQATQQSLANLQQAAQAIVAMRAAQAQAAAAALNVPSTVPNGLVAGGLQPATGATANSPLWSGANLPTQSSSGGRTNVTVQQTSQQAALTWQTFNVGKSTALTFDQSAGGSAANTWVVVNRVNDSSAQPSQILGSITAPGQVYVINANGIIFGGASQVNVNALIASSADFTGSANGIYSTQAGNGAYLPSFAAAAAIVVQAGAQITANAPISATDGGGYVLLMGSSVQNAGSITTSGGQTALAAGQGFILRPGYGVTQNADGSLSGNLTSTTLGSEIAISGTGGAVGNAGLIQASTGDITLVGHSVTQAGVALATTSVSQRGTIHLLTDTTDATASVTLAPGSLTYLAPDASTATALNSQRAIATTPTGSTDAQLPAAAYGGETPLNDQVQLSDTRDASRIEITSGGTVNFQGQSLTLATAGQIAVSAAGRIFTETGAQLDVSGLANVALPMSANNLAVSIESFELRDAPNNRVSTQLNNLNVTVDIGELDYVPAGTGGYSNARYYTSGGLLEVSGELNNVGHTIDEWSTIGGTITLAAP